MSVKLFGDEFPNEVERFRIRGGKGGGRAEDGKESDESASASNVMFHGGKNYQKGRARARALERSAGNT